MFAYAQCRPSSSCTTTASRHRPTLVTRRHPWQNLEYPGLVDNHGHAYRGDAEYHAWNSGHFNFRQGPSTPHWWV
jgi:hypothetical protein